MSLVCVEDRHVRKRGHALFPPARRGPVQNEGVNRALRRQLDRGFNLDPPIKDRLELLMILWNTDQHGEPVLMAHLGSLDLSYVQCRQNRLTALDGYGWVTLGAVQSPIDRLRVTSEGRAVAEEVDQRRRDRRTRRQAARNAVLYWLDEPAAAGTGSVTVDGMGSFGWFLGVPFTDDEIGLATTWLHDRGFIQALTVAWDGDIIRPTLSAKGQDVVESDEDANRVGGGSANSEASFRGGAGPVFSPVIHNHGPATNNMAGGNITGSGTVVLAAGQRSQLKAILDQIERARVELAPAAPSEAEELGRVGADLAAQETSGTADVEMLEDGLTRVTDVATRTSVAVGAVSLVATKIMELLSTFTM